LKIGGGAVLLLWANTFSPFGMNRQKWILEWNISPFNYFSPFGEHNMSEDYTKVGELLGATAKDELWSGVEAFVYAEDSKSLSIYDFIWNSLENTLVITYKRDMIKGIFMSYVCKTSKEIPRIKNI
jgi:hypothetical protein